VLQQFFIGFERLASFFVESADTFLWSLIHRFTGMRDHSSSVVVSSKPKRLIPKNAGVNLDPVIGRAVAHRKRPLKKIQGDAWRRYSLKRWAEDGGPEANELFDF